MAASREVGATDELAISPPADDQVVPAIRAGAANFFGLCLGNRHLRLRPLDLRLKCSVKIRQHFMPVFFTRGHLVQVGFHTGGKVQIDNVREMLDHEVID